MSVDYNVGDVIEGFFAADVYHLERVIVRGRVPADTGHPAGFHGDCLDYREGKGYGSWGYDSQVKTVVGPATPDDERAVAQNRARVEADTDRFIRGLR